MSKDLLDSPDSRCIGSAVAVLGDKWSARIIQALYIETRRFSALEKLLPGISPRTLSQRLDMLEEHQIIQRHTCKLSPSRLDYSLTEKGQDLVPILRSMAEWSNKYPHTEEQLASTPSSTVRLAV